VHRVGKLGVGDLAVVVAASAAHRAEAFAACRALIDTLKEQVPIWKREEFRNGSHTWVGI
jgi:molybdopterin synthase catalytic subunit